MNKEVVRIGTSKYWLEEVVRSKVVMLFSFVAIVLVSHKSFPNEPLQKFTLQCDVLLVNGLSGSACTWKLLAKIAESFFLWLLQVHGEQHVGDLDLIVRLAFG